MNVVRLTPEEWAQYSALAHELVFNEIKDPETERVAFALLALHEDRPAAYVTCQELDSKTLYWQYGGMFPSVKGSIHAFKAYRTLVDYCLGNYNRVCFRVENKNLAMLKFALKLGFEIVGLRVYKGQIFLEHVLEK